jgi:hypothetical protein
MDEALTAANAPGVFRESVRSGVSLISTAPLAPVIIENEATGNRFKRFPLKPDLFPPG